MAFSSQPLSSTWSYSKIALLGFYATTLLACSLCLQAQKEKLNVKRSDFPRDFLFGVGTSALQSEGSTESEGKGPSVWDSFFEKNPGALGEGSNIRTALDSYQRYKEDAKYVKELGVDSYRFSIPWTRILPNGSLSGGVNKEGIDHYNRLIDQLIEYGIKPFVTILHFDPPQILEDKYGGPLSRCFVDDFKDYAEILFKTYGDRVKYWITMNEPVITATFGYDFGMAPQGRCSNRKICKAGNSSIEPYTLIHILVLAHATAATLYKQKYQAKQGGQIGVTLSSLYHKPYSKSSDDKAAAKRALEFEIGWFMKPLVFGDYPKIMRDIVKDRLPRFTAKEKTLVMGSFDFIGLNYYSARYVKNIPIDFNALPVSYTADKFINITVERNGVLIDGSSEEGAVDNIIYPRGLQKLLKYMKTKYDNPTIYITENGFLQKRNDSVPLKVQLNDQACINYILRHLYRIRKAIKKGVKVKGYFYWSLADDFEFTDGYKTAYGLYHIDYSNDLSRIPRDSAKWFKHFLHDA